MPDTIQSISNQIPNSKIMFWDTERVIFVPFNPSTSFENDEDYISAVASQFNLTHDYDLILQGWLLFGKWFLVTD